MVRVREPSLSSLLDSGVLAWAGGLEFGTIVTVVEVAAGIALLGGVFVPLALTLLAPIEIGILATHLAFEPSGLLIIAVLMALTLYLAWSYRSVFAPMLQARVEPTPATTHTSTHAASAAARA